VLTHESSTGRLFDLVHLTRLDICPTQRVDYARLKPPLGALAFGVQNSSSPFMIRSNGGTLPRLSDNNIFGPARALYVVAASMVRSIWNVRFTSARSSYKPIDSRAVT